MGDCGSNGLLTTVSEMKWKPYFACRTTIVFLYKGAASDAAKTFQYIFGSWLP